VKYDEAATIPLAFDTASTGLYNSNKYGLGLTPPWEKNGIGMYSGTPIVILGGSSAVGSFGKLRVARTVKKSITSTSLFQPFSWLASLGFPLSLRLLRKYMNSA
jgi:NADPH:quinone reductase-like Zn-dependent oxidoreductase